MADVAEALLSLHRLTFNRPGLGRELIHVYGSAEQTLKYFDSRLTPLPPALDRDLRNVANSLEHQHRVAKDISWQSHDNHHLLVESDSRYPALLQQINDPPLVLFCWGNPSTLQRDQVAIVGSRRASANGMATAETFAAELCACGFAVTSGLALGIDGAAHRGAIAAGGETIAVQAVGAGDIYPRRHVRLAQQIAETGCVITEYPTDTPAFARYFPSRNRIVTGLSRGVLVVEARLGSGSLISARLAVEQGREVFAVPGSILVKYSEGCHHLIRQGAKLAGSIADIIEEFPEFEVKRHRRQKSLTEAEQAVITILEEAPCHADRIHELTGIDVPELMTLLMNLEIQQTIESGPQGYRVKSYQP
jgi:DNA processing protein